MSLALSLALLVVPAHAGPGRKAVERMKEACTGGDAAVCVQLADAHLDGDGRWLPQDPVAHRRYLQRACGMGVADACVRLARSLHELIDERSRPSDLKRIVDLYERACTQGIADACAEVSNTAEAWREPLELTPAVLKLRHQTACHAGFDDACQRVTLVDAMDLGDPAHAVDLASDAAAPFHAVIAEHTADLSGCYAPKLDWNHQMEGRVHVRLGVGTHGEVLDARLLSSSARDSELEACVLDALGELSFPPAEALVRTIEARFDLKRWGGYLRPLETAEWLETRCEAGDNDACSRLADIDPPAVRAYQASEGTRVVGRADRFEIGDVIGSQEEAIKECYVDGLARDRELAGKITFRLAVGPDGTVTTAIVDASTVDDGGVESCLRRVVMAQTYPVPEGGGLAVTTHTIPLHPDMID